MLGSDLTQRPPNQIMSVHWDATGATLADASTQWCSSGDLVLICIVGTHWKTTGATSTLGCHWNHTGWCLHPVVSQWRSSVHLHNWNTLEDHWKHTGISPVAFQAHWIATGRPLAQGKGLYFSTIYLYASLPEQIFCLGDGQISLGLYMDRATNMILQMSTDLQIGKLTIITSLRTTHAWHAFLWTPDP